MNIADYNLEIQKINKELMTARASMSNSYINVCNRLLKKAREIDDANLIGYALYYLADSYYMITTSYKKFNTNLLKAIELLQQCCDYEHLSRCYNLLGIDAMNHGNLEIALDFFLTALKYSEMVEYSEVPGLIEYNIGQIYFQIGEVKKALSYIRAAYKNISRNKNDSLYYRNVLYCYCFEADCYIILGKPSLVEKCLIGIDRLEANPKVNREYFIDIPVVDIRMRGYYYLEDTSKYNYYSQKLSEMVKSNGYPLDTIEDVFGVCRFLMKIGKAKDAIRLSDRIEKSINDLDIHNLKKDHAKLKCELYEAMGNKEARIKALEEFLYHSKEQERESVSNYRFFADIRAKLSTIEQENSMLQRQAETDSLTGLANRYSLNKYLDQAFERAFERRYSFAVEMLDVDNFKRYNDKCGHQAGDECLKRIAEVISDKCSSESGIHAFRYGGDEFVLIYEGKTDTEVMKCAQHFRKAVKDLAIAVPGSEGAVVTISQGIRNSVPQETAKVWDYMYAADNALYEVKDHKKGDIYIQGDRNEKRTSQDI